MVGASVSGASALGLVEAGAEDGGIDTGKPACLGGGGCILLRGGGCILLRGEITMDPGNQATARLIPGKMSWLCSRKRPPG